MSEHSEQAAFIETVLLTYRNRDDFIRPLFFAVPNGAVLGGNRFALANKLKAEGQVNGVSDILYLQPRGRYSFLAIEMKTEKRRKEKNGGISDEQQEFMMAVERVGGWGVVCYGADEAIIWFSDYMAKE